MSRVREESRGALGAHIYSSKTANVTNCMILLLPIYCNILTAISCQMLSQQLADRLIKLRTQRTSSNLRLLNAFAVSLLSLLNDSQS